MHHDTQDIPFIILRTLLPPRQLPEPGALRTETALRHMEMSTLTRLPSEMSLSLIKVRYLHNYATCSNIFTALELATSLSASFLTDGGNDGLLGLAWPKLNTVTPHQVATPMENMINMNLLELVREDASFLALA